MSDPPYDILPERGTCPLSLTSQIRPDETRPDQEKEDLTRPECAEKGILQSRNQELLLVENGDSWFKLLDGNKHNRFFQTLGLARRGWWLSGEKWWIAIARIVLGHTIVSAARAHNWPRPTWHIVSRAKSLIYQMIRWPVQKLRNKKLLIFFWSSNQRKNLSALTNSTLTLQQCDVIWANADNSVLLSAPKRPRSPPKIYLPCPLM